MIGKLPIEMEESMRGEGSGGPVLSEEILAIIPDFKKWRSVFFRLDIIFIIAVFLLECVFCAVSYMEGMTQEPLGRYLLLHIALPTLLNALILFLASNGMKRMHEMDLRQNAIPVFAMVLICAVTSLVHTALFAVTCVFCIPICMTTVFSNKMMCRGVTAASVVGAVLVTAKRILMADATGDVLRALLEGVIAAGIMFMVGLVAQNLLSMTDGQKNKLLSYAKNMKEAHYRAEAASSAKSAFLANMSHEIRTPINAILGMIEMILRESRDENITDYAQNVQEAGNSLLYLVNDILDITKIESGKLEIVESTFETSSFVHDCYNMIHERAAKKGLEFKVECDPQLPSQVRCDEIRFRQAVTNLLSNAIKYTEKGNVALTVGSCREGEQFCLVVMVKDTGIGIQEEHIQELFEQFTRFDLKRNRNIEGTGLGLAITKQLVDLMHGDIEVQSIYGVGSCFTIKMPVQIIDDTPMGDFQRRYRDVTSKNAKYKQSFEAPDARILVVDDVEVNLRVIANLLKVIKVKVDTAKSGRECLAKVAEISYDLILMDHMMPEMDGVETYERMKESDSLLNKDTPVIMVTANAITGVRERYLQSGFVDYLSKPVQSAKLERMILKYLPKDKIRTDFSEGEQTVGGENQDQAFAAASGDADAGGDSRLQKLFQQYPQMDIALGLSYCGEDVDIYLSILEVFRDEAKMVQLDDCRKRRDAENYRILAHGVKSSSLSAGFPALSEKARALEDAAKAGDWDSIGRQHEAFVAEYRRVVEAISASL